MILPIDEVIRREDVIVEHVVARLVVQIVRCVDVDPAFEDISRGIRREDVADDRVAGETAEPLVLDEVPRRASCRACRGRLLHRPREPAGSSRCNVASRAALTGAPRHGVSRKALALGRSEMPGSRCRPSLARNAIPVNAHHLRCRPAHPG